MRHLKIEEIISYIANKLPEGDSFQLESHIADCAECAKNVNNYYKIRNNFDEIWDSLRPPADLDRMIEDLKEVSEKEKEIQNAIEKVLKEHILRNYQITTPKDVEKNRIEAWMENIGQRTEAAIGIELNASIEKTYVNEEGLEAFGHLGRIRDFTSPVVYHGQGEGEEASKTVSAMDAEGGEVKVYGAPGQVLVTLRIPNLKKPWPLAVLVPLKKGKSLISAFSRPTEGAKLLMAKFNNIENSKYVILLERFKTA